MFVVVADIGREDAFEMVSIDDQDAVEIFAAHGANPSFDERVRAGCPSTARASRPSVTGRVGRVTKPPFGPPSGPRFDSSALASRRDQ